MSFVLDLGDGQWVRRFVGFLAGKLAELNLLPPALSVRNVWRISFGVAMLTWFQPVLLRLGLFRGVLWFTLFAVICAARVFTGATSLTADASLLSLAAALPGLTLIGVRTRPWMILPAAAAFSAMVIGLNRDSHKFAPLAANLPYAATLLYGTQHLRVRAGLENRSPQQGG
jgi:hypothetical protein